MSNKTVLLETNGPVATLTISRPEAMNALNSQVMSDLNSALDELNSEVRCLILTGEGKAFVAGADIKEMEAYTPEQALKMAESGQTVLNNLENLNVPSIAVVNGFALGGGLELALSCDFIIASTKAKLGLPEVSLGLIPGYGGTQRLSRYAGKAIARRVALTGDIYSAQQFYEWGVVTQLAEPDELMTVAGKVAQTISSRAPLALAAVKKAVNNGFDMPQTDGLAAEGKLFSETFATDDHNEGIKAFIEKRPPQFQGR